MAETYSKLQTRIAQLQRQADKIRRTETEGVIKKIKVAIKAYGITAEDLFGGGGVTRAARGPGRRARAGAASARYSDGAGHTWGGRGPRPQWLRDALAAGRSLTDFEAGAAVPSEPKAAGPAARKRGGGSGIAVKYRDGENTWTGRGSQPRWLRAALGEGRKLEDFAV